MTMKKQARIYLLGALLLLLQLFFFRDYLSPIHWGQIKVSGLACTCPDETVVNGQLYLRSITPDSLKQFNLNYSEIYVTEKPSTKIDYMGSDLYIIKGGVIGKKGVSEYDPWNLIVRVDGWRPVNLLKDWAVKGLFFTELLFFIIIFTKVSQLLKY